MFVFYVLSFFKKGDIIQGRTLIKEIRYSSDLGSGNRGIEIPSIGIVLNPEYIIYIIVLPCSYLNLKSRVQNSYLTIIISIIQEFGCFYERL